MTMIDLSRRDLFTIGGALGVTSVAAHAEKLTGDDTAGLKTYHATCSMECLHCNLKATVKDGKVIKIESDNPFDGKACAKGLARIKWMYAKNRVLHPMKRVGERGSGKFVPISWDEALDTVAAKMKEARRTARRASSSRTSPAIWTRSHGPPCRASVTILAALRQPPVRSAAPRSQAP